jgi:hypothetical protein
MRRLLRRAGPDSDTRSERGSEPERGAARRSQRMRTLACATLLATAALVAPAAGAEPLREDELPNWIPSFGVGFGIQTRDVRGRIDNPNKPGLGVVISEINNSSIPPFFKPILIEQARANPLYGGAFLPTGVPIKEPTGPPSRSADS